MDNENRSLKIAVVGAGAVGGICAAMIAKAGYDVQVVVRREEQAVAIKEKGIRVTGIKGEVIVPVDAVCGAGAMAEDRDLVLLGVKATALAEAAQLIEDRISSQTMVVSLQNGFCEDFLGSILGRERVIGCVTGWGATMHGDRDFEMTSTGDFIIGNIDNQPDPRLGKVREVLNHVLETKISNNITGSLYSKLIINSCITSVGALCGLYLGQMLARKQARLIFLAVMEEAMAVAAAMELQVEVFAGKLDYYTFCGNKGWLSNIKRHAFLRILGFKYRRLKSSSLQSLERGQRTEIDYLTGYITAKGAEYGVPTPVNDQIQDMVHAIEQKTLTISPENIKRIHL